HFLSDTKKLKGKLDAARVEIDAALKFQEQLNEEFPGDPEIKFDLARSRIFLGHLGSISNSANTPETYQRAIVLVESLAHQYQNVAKYAKYQESLAESYRNLAIWHA